MAKWWPWEFLGGEREREREEMSILLHGEKVNGASFLVKKTFGFIWAIQMLHSRYAVV
jgi:hypothetical protein